MKRLCVSACLLGAPCRWKGDSKPCEAVQRLAEGAKVRALDAQTARFLSQAEFAEPFSFTDDRGPGGAAVEIVPFCPEVAAGLGCPRPPIELVRTDEGVRVLRVDRKGDVTDALRAACEAQADALARTGGVDGFILKARSPSCGLSSPLHDAAGRQIGAAPGLWAALARERFPAADFRDETNA